MHCKNCKNEVGQETALCPTCEFPIHGTEEVQGIFFSKQIRQKSDVEESIKKLKTARNILFGLGGFYVLVPFTPLMNSTSSVTLTSAIIGVLFIGFGFFTFKKPKIALLVPLALIILYYLALLLINPGYLITGLLWKILVLMGVGYGYTSVSKANKILKENPYLASLMGFSHISNK
ncbi:hypothetical protein BFP72_16275 [Reichenbachiella sp. 5M10]|uniref:hypothetical protein n=1 Tax=Reichenbachiella sp. 5M10 TaxID=1889772 RepID=UPI000C148CC6|nr:hypothetical protein [Reichenbachiella sp. 5M10]PIB36843.1 hypothetical protein BFP72_16275 [Reichenbachiella sp. 5M10]